MPLKISHKSGVVAGELTIPGSKSESNRLLILQAIFPNLKINNLSSSDDTLLLQNALNSSEETIDIHHAGTAMRFLTAFFSFQKNQKTRLTGSQRMQERPIKLLVEALQNLGAHIKYAKKEGFPPLEIEGKHLEGGKIGLPANISSQYISALMLIAAALPNGLEITLEGKITSRAYIEMTLELLKKLGVEAFFENEKIRILNKKEILPQEISVEPDWSSASYIYSIAALSKEANIKLFHFKKSSLQGDAIVAEIYKNFGIQTVFEEDYILLEKIQHQKPKKIKLDLQNSPDLAQTIAVTCLGLGIDCYLTGLHTLRIKETDRLQALKNELQKFGASVEISENSIRFSKTKNSVSEVLVSTYNDHRMAMAFAPLAIFSSLKIEDPAVVSKSYPSFWNDLEVLGFELQKS